MAKLTDAQKVANKAAAKARDAAYRARREEYRQAETKIMAPLELETRSGLHPLVEAYKRADAWLEEAQARRDAENQEIRDRIAELEAQLKQLSAKHRIDRLAYERREAVSNWQAARNEARRAVDAQFPDIAGIHSAVEWDHKRRELGLLAGSGVEK